MTYDEGEHTKEVFAHFGHAYFLAAVFEHPLGIALLQLEFLTEEKSEIERKGRKHFNRTKFETDFDAFMHRQYAKTLGSLIRRVHDLADMDDALKKLITTAKARRDFLAHHFFRERAEDFARRSGRDKMLTELQDAQALFETADEKLTDYMKPTLKQLGFCIETIEAHIQNRMRSIENIK